MKCRATSSKVCACSPTNRHADQSEATVRRNRVLLSKFKSTRSLRNWIQLQFLSDLVDLNFESKTRLRRTVASLWSAWRFVGEHAQTFELVARHFISHSLKRARVERARHTVAAIRTTIEERTEVHRRYRAVFFHPRPDRH